MANNSSTVDIYAIFIIFLNYAVAELYKVTTRTHTDWWVYADTPLLAMGGGGAKMDDIRPSHDNISLIVRHCTEIN